MIIDLRTYRIKKEIEREALINSRMTRRLKLLIIRSRVRVTTSSEGILSEWGKVSNGKVAFKIKRSLHKK